MCVSLVNGTLCVCEDEGEGEGEGCPDGGGCTSARSDDVHLLASPRYLAPQPHSRAGPSLHPRPRLYGTHLAADAPGSAAASSSTARLSLDRKALEGFSSSTLGTRSASRSAMLPPRGTRSSSDRPREGWGGREGREGREGWEREPTQEATQRRGSDKAGEETAQSAEPRTTRGGRGAWLREGLVGRGSWVVGRG